VAFTLGSPSQWYKNIQHKPEVSLYIKGQPLKVRGEQIHDPDEVAAVLDVYKRDQPNNYQRFFGVPLDLPSAEAARSPNLRAKYVRFHPVQ
jgi:hypothetical protein